MIPNRYHSTYPGDINADENTIVLCPTHAVIADAISGTHDNRKGAEFSQYRGPKTKAELLVNLRSLDADPDGWANAYWPTFDGHDALNVVNENIGENAEASVPGCSEPQQKQCPPDVPGTNATDGAGMRYALAVLDFSRKMAF